MQGTVKWFNKEEGFGFITSEENRNVFVGWKDIITDKFPTLNSGDKVVFSEIQGIETLKAIKVKIIN